MFELAIAIVWYIDALLWVSRRDWWMALLYAAVAALYYRAYLRKRY